MTYSRWLSKKHGEVENRMSSVTEAKPTNVTEHLLHSKEPVFACPYLKFDIVKYARCVHRGWTKSRLKEHLGRRHRVPPHCPTCYATFSTDLARDAHTRDISCKANTNAAPEGLFEDQPFPADLGALKRVMSTPFPRRHGFLSLPPGIPGDTSALFDTALPKWSEPNNQGWMNDMHRDSAVPPLADYAHIDKACPDSVYGSGSYHTYLTKPESVPGKEDLQNELSETADAMTSYSDVTRISPDQHQQYIQSLADAISKKLGGLIGADNRQALVNALPDLVKAFAIRIGHENDTQKHRAIMHFAHQYHAQIARQVESDFSELDKTNEKPSQHSMSLLEKINMWNNIPSEHQSSTEQEFFEGVKDVDDDEQEYTPLTLDNHQEIASRSNAFQWLVSDLWKISFLKGYGENVIEETSMTSIQTVIRRCFPTGRLRKAQGPRVYVAAFSMHGWLGRTAVDILNYVVVTCYSEESQATTIRHYMNQIWPSTGQLVLDLLVAVFQVAEPTIQSDGPGHFGESQPSSNMTILPDGTRVEVSLHHEDLLVAVAGPTNTIIECGEQLAWLNCAMIPPNGIKPSGERLPSSVGFPYHDDRTDFLGLNFHCIYSCSGLGRARPMAKKVFCKEPPEL
ncbi:hypothetical protein CSOJ01_03937 [Colletotrichum sojae]|uniref:C2H2-type domain-containing protein n=1 Tax=Colletotrichum sojae TaxID=2175907 RepID=A0A8H6MZF2_9PEZI|nr:hypothetical protein CSOJ01_03937 [Colletotrichum sojae]